MNDCYYKVWHYFAGLCSDNAPPSPLPTALLPDVWHEMFMALARHYGANEWGAALVWEHIGLKSMPLVCCEDVAAKIAAEIEAMVRA